MRPPVSLARRLPLSLVRPYMMETAKHVATVGLSASAITLGAMYVLQRQLLFPAPHEVAPISNLVRLDDIACAWFPPPKDGRVLIYFHGNADQIGWSGAYLARLFAKRNLGFLAVEYPGYGLSKGAPSEASIYAAAASAVDYAKTQVTADRIVLLGQSIGAAPALAMATRHPDITRVALISPFESVPAMARTLLPVVPDFILRSLVKDPFDNLALVPHLPSSTNTLILHGTQDEIVPFAHGQHLADLVSSSSSDWFSSDDSPKPPTRSFIPINGAGHNDILAPPFDAVVMDALVDFAVAPSR